MDQIIVVVDEKIHLIDPKIYGHFTEHIGGLIYDGIWVGRDSTIPNINGFRAALIEAMRRISAPVIRWPGGCFAETYDWRDGIGPAAERPVTAGWWYRNDGRLESNQVGTAEFIGFCRSIGAEPYLAANITSATPLEIRNWIDYCNMPANSSSLARLRSDHGDHEPYDVRYWGIGNETWGGGGNMTPEDYATEFRKYATVTANLAGQDSTLVACGPSGNDIDWTLRFFKKMSDRIAHPSQLMQGFSAHYYCGTAGDALRYDENQWYQLLSQAAEMEPLIVQQRAAMDAFDPQRSIGLIVDEWGCWHPGGSGPSAGGNLFEQQSTMRDAVVTALTLNIFNNHSDKVVMANIAQLVNNLHSLFLAREEHLIATPNFHVFDMYKGHQGGESIRTLVETDTIEYDSGTTKGEVVGLTCSSSLKARRLTITAANIRYDSAVEVRITLRGATAAGTAQAAVLAVDDPHRHNTFDSPDEVKASWSDLEVEGSTIEVRLPPASVLLLEIPLQ